MSKTKNTGRAYQIARDRYAKVGDNTDQALEQLGGISISIHCWQGDDLGGFESAGQDWAAAWLRPVIIRAKRAHRGSCAGTLKRPFRSSPAAIASTSTLPT